MRLSNIPPEFTEEIVSYLPETTPDDVLQLFHLEERRFPQRIDIWAKVEPIDITCPRNRYDMPPDSHHLHPY